MSLLVAQSIEVRERELEAVVHVPDEGCVRSAAFPGLAERAARILPGLARHSCDNDLGLRFVDEIRDTEMPHLLEHVTCEIMALAGSPRSLRANTSWDFAHDGPRVFRVRIAFDDEHVALGAFALAIEVTDWLAHAEGPPPAIEARVRHLRELRSR